VTVFTSRREQKRFVKFAIVGTIGAGVDFLIFNLCLGALGLAPLLSQALSFLAAVSSNFMLNRYWTFKDSRSKQIGIQIGQYVLVNFVGLLIRTPIFNGLSTVFERALGQGNHPFGIDAYTLAHNLALGGAIGVVLLWNYFVNRKWTFGDV
jgi:putative flippase GtrA